MKSDLVHSIVQPGPQVQWPKANHKTTGAQEPNFDEATKRTLLEPAILERLVTEVKETVATGVAMPGARAPKSSFSALNLWAIRRNRRYSASSRKQPRIVTGFGY